jgi:hypothetical protein
MNTRTRNQSICSKKIEEESNESASSTSSDSEEIPITNQEEKQKKEIMNKSIRSETETENQTSLIFRTAKTTVYVICDAAKIYLLWVLLHYVASQLYIPFCSPRSFWGFIITPILAVTPQCKALRWVIHTGGNTMETMWVIFGAWCCAKVVPTTASALTMLGKPKISSGSGNRDRAVSYDHVHEQNRFD